MAIDCEGFEGAVLDFLYGELPAEKRGDIDAHASACGECSQLHRELSEARQVAHALPARETPPRELDERIAIAARAAADLRDVRRHPLRGGALHVAAAVLLASLLATASFAIGTRYPRLRPLPQDALDPPFDDPPLPERRTGPEIEAAHRNAPPAPPRPEGRDPGRKYSEDLLQMGKEKLAKGDHAEALRVFRGVYATTGRSMIALDAHLGIARALQGLGKTDEALAAAESARDENDAWTFQDADFDREASALVRELRAIKERLR